MIIPLGERYQQGFHIFEKREGELVRTKLISTLFVPMTGESEDRREIKPDPLNPKIVNGGFEIDENDDQRPDGWHYQRQATLVSDEAPAGSQCVRFDNADPGQAAQMLQGMAVDGRRVRALSVGATVKYEKIAPGPKSYQKPQLVVHFYNAARRPIEDRIVGPWSGSSDWQRKSATVSVPPSAREAVVRIGLNGATGTLWVDEVTLTAKTVSKKRR